MYSQFSQPCPVIFGRGAVQAVGEKLAELGCKKVLCVYESGVEKAGIADKVIQVIRDKGIEVVSFKGVVPDPTTDVVDEGGAIARREKVDGIVGIGGGSSMDTAKAISILLTKPGQAKDYVLAVPISIDTKTPVLLVPTTAGTGSEVTRVAVITRPDVNAKWSVFVNTTCAIVDPELTLTLPKNQTATTGMDALSHAMEAITGKNPNPHSDLVGEAAIRKIAKFLPVACEEPDNIEARTEMSLAATFAGLAFNDPITHVGHAIADALSCRFHTPHGYNCAVALPAAMRLVAPAVPEKMRVIAEAMGASLTGSESGEELGHIVAGKILELMRKIGIEPLSKYAPSREEVLKLAPEVVSNHLSSYCPVEITEEVAEKLLAEVYDNY